MDIDLEELAAMVELLKGADFSEFRYEKGDLRIEIRRGGSDSSVSREPLQQVRPVAVHAATANPTREGPASVVACAAGEQRQPVTAPILGTFYRRPKPGEAPFVAVGDLVEADTVICIIEVMKLMNSVVAGARGVVAAVHANDGDLVEFGQPLFSLDPVAD